MIKFVIDLNILEVKKMVLQIALIINCITRIDSYNCLPIEEIWAFHNVIVLIKSVFNENKNH